MKQSSLYHSYSFADRQSCFCADNTANRIDVEYGRSEREISYALLIQSSGIRRDQ